VVDTRHEYDRVVDLYLPIAAAVVAIVALLVVFYALRYRARDGDQDARPPSRVANAPKTELVYTVVLAGIAALLLWKTFTVEERTDRGASGAPVRVDVTAAKWHWRFDYPQYRIVQRGTDRRPPTLVVPAGRRVGFTMRSIDVIHAFWIPSRRYKRDATPGLKTTFSMTFPRPGFLKDGGECSEYCGLNHVSMRFNVRVLTPAAFARWVAARRAAARVAGAGA
jgi:cytochrome c oxidase subunit 2